MGIYKSRGQVGVDVSNLAQLLASNITELSKKGKGVKPVLDVAGKSLAKILRKLDGRAWKVDIHASKQQAVSKSLRQKIEESKASGPFKTQYDADSLFEILNGDGSNLDTSSKMRHEKLILKYQDQINNQLEEVLARFQAELEKKGDKGLAKLNHASKVKIATRLILLDTGNLKAKETREGRTEADRFIASAFKELIALENKDVDIEGLTIKLKALSNDPEKAQKLREKLTALKNMTLGSEGLTGALKSVKNLHSHIPRIVNSTLKYVKNPKSVIDFVRYLKREAFDLKHNIAVAPKWDAITEQAIARRSTPMGKGVDVTKTRKVRGLKQNYLV